MTARNETELEFYGNISDNMDDLSMADQMSFKIKAKKGVCLSPQSESKVKTVLF